MLSSAQRDIIKATIPLLETGGEVLTTHFYQRMFSQYPEVRPLFNQAHQASGSQPRALASSVLMYARNIDHPEALAPLAARIVNKHAALQVQPEHYPIVGTCLLQAIREVLGAEVATDAVLEAWAVAYQQLADLLIAAEQQLYDQQAAASGGWRGSRTFRVVRRVAESTEVVSFYLEPADGGLLMDFQPGQYIGLQLWIDGEEVRRNYSLSAVADGRCYRISVKREPGGRASGYLHDQVSEGSELQVFAPAGEFVLDQGGRPLLLLAGGIGITPLLAMAEAALVQGSRPVTLVHWVRDAGVQAFARQLQDWAGRFPQFQAHVIFGQPAPDQATLQQWAPGAAGSEVYFVGPRPFMACLKRQLGLLGVADGQLHYEFFGPAGELA